MSSEFEDFVKEKRYLQNVSPRTVKFYRDCKSAWDRTVGGLPTEAKMKEFVIKLLESGISPATVNSYIRGFNSYLTWLHENHKLLDKLRLKKVKEPQRVIKTFSDEQLRVLLSWKPRTFYDQRLYALIAVVIDTGVRIDEALQMRRSQIDFDNLLITVRGKGDKERVIPISNEARKVLYRFVSKHNHRIVFPARQGDKLSYFNSLRDFKALCEKLGITGVRCSWHTLRHSFATSYIREGGNIFYLQRVLGHSDLATTRIYVQSQTEDLSMMHKKTSILSRLR